MSKKRRDKIGAILSYISLKILPSYPPDGWEAEGRALEFGRLMDEIEELRDTLGESSDQELYKLALATHAFLMLIVDEMLKDLAVRGSYQNELEERATFIDELIGELEEAMDDSEKIDDQLIISLEIALEKALLALDEMLYEEIRNDGATYIPYETAGAISNDIIMTMSTILSGSPASKSLVTRPAEPQPTLIKPSELVAKCDEYVIGQASVKRALAVYMASHYNSAIHMDGVSRPSILITGPSGSGKSYIVKHMAKALGKHFMSVDITEYSATGYVGKSVMDILNTLRNEAADSRRASEAVIFIDEIDKISSANDLGDMYARVQAELLKFVEDDAAKGYNHCFVFAGAFSDLRERKAAEANACTIGFKKCTVKSGAEVELDHNDLIKAGIFPELVGRIGTIASTTAITEDMFTELLTVPKGCVKEYYNRLFKDQGLKDKVTDKDIKQIIQKIKGLGSVLGVRGLKAIAEAHFRDRLYW